MSEDFASIVIIKRTGGDGPRYPLRRNECLFGRDASCDLRVQLPGVALEHAKVSRSENRNFVLENLSDCETMLNGNLMKEPVGLSNKDVFSIAGRFFRFEYEQPKRKSLGPKRLSLNNSRPLVSPLKEANHVVKDSPRNPLPRRASLRESMGKLRRSSVPCQEVEEPVSTCNTPEKIEKQTNPKPRRTSLRESMGKLRRSSVPLQEVEELVSNTPGKVEEQVNPLPRRTSLRESMGNLRRSSVALQEEEEPKSNSPEEPQLNSAMPTPKSYVTTPLSTKKQQKRVSFGPKLSPEQFDKALPVSTPIRKGATPRRLSAPLSKSCISPARRRRYSVAASSFASKIEEESESDDEDLNPPTDEGPDVEVVDVLQTDWPKLVTPLRAEIKEGKNLRVTNKKMETPLKNAIKQGFRLKATKKKLNTPLRKEIQGGKKLKSTRKRLDTPVRKAIEAKPKLRATKMRMPTPVRQAIEAKPSLRQTKKAMKTDLQDEIKKGKSLRQTKKVLPEPLQEEIKNGRKFLRVKRRMKSELQDEIVAGKQLNETTKKMAVELQEEIVQGVQLRSTRKRMPTMLQDEIKSGIELSKTKQSLKTPLRKEIESGVNLRKTKRRMGTMLQDEIKSGIELSKTKQSLKTPLRKEIKAGVNLRKTKRRMGTMLQDEIKSGIELSKTKQSLKTPLRKEIKAGVNLRKTKRRMGTMLQDEIKSGIELSKTKQSMKTPLRKEIESGVNLRKTKRRMATMLQDEIKSGIELSKTKQSVKTPLRKEIESGVNLRKTKRRMGTMLQDEIKSGIELSKTKQSLKTPIRKEIESGITLRKIKRRMPTMLQNEIQSGIELSKTKQSLKTPIRKEIETGIQLRPTKPKDEQQPATHSKTPKRRFSSIDDDGTSQSTRKKLKTPSKTPQQAGFFPSTRSRTRSISRRKSTKKPSYAEILKRPKLVAKRRLSTKQKNVFKFEAEQQMVSKSNNTAESKAAENKSEVSKKSKTPSRRKSLARSKVFDGKIANEWNVVVNKRKIKKIKRQRAVKPQQQIDMEGVSSLFKTPKATRSQTLVETEKEETPVRRLTTKLRMSNSPGDAVLYGVAKLMKTPKIKPSNEPDIEGVAELFEVLEMASPIAVSKTPSLRRASDRVSIVCPLSINKTPSLRMKENVNDVVFPLQLSSTPSLRKGSENVTIACAQEPLRTPSLRRDSDALTVSSVQELAHTPSLSQGENNLIVVMAAIPNVTPSLKKTSENVLVSSPLLATVTPSLKSVPKVVAAESPVPSTPPTEIGKSGSTKKQPSVAVVSPLPVQSTIFEIQPTSAEPFLSQPTPPSDDLTPTAGDEEPVTSKTAVTKRSTRSKRKIEPESLPAAKRPRRATTRSNSKVVENAESEIELPSGRANTRSNKSVVTSHPQVPKRTRARSTKHSPVAVETVENNLHEPLVVVDLEEQAEDKVVSRSKRTTRTRRPVLTEQPILVPEDFTSKPTKDEEPTSKITRSTRSKSVVIPDSKQDEKPTRRTTSRHNSAKVVTEKEPEIKDTKKSVASESKAPKKTRTKSAKHRSNVADLREQGENDIDSESKRNTRGSRRKPTTAKGKVQSNSKSSLTPKIPTRSEKSKNVAGIPETPQPLQFTKTKLEPIIEVPTPASSLRGSAIKKSLLESQPKTRGGRDISTVIEEVVEPVMPMPVDESAVAKPEVVKGRVSRGKRAVVADQSVGEIKEATSVTGRVTRAKRGITAVVVLEDLPAPKRQKKEAVKGEGNDDGKTVEQEKRAGRHTRRATQQKKVVEELTISNTRSTRRKKPAAVKEIVEETVVTYTRTTRQKSKPVEEAAIFESSAEGKSKRARRGNGGKETIGEDSGSRTKTRTRRQKQVADEENGNVKKGVEKEVKVSRSRSKRAVKAQDEVAEQITRITRSRRAAK